MAIALATTSTQAAVEVITAPRLTPGEARRLHALERRIESGFQTFREIGAALMEIRDSRLYRATHTSFETYCREQWDMDRQRAYQLIDAVAVIRLIGADNSVRNESTARELVPIMHADPEAAVRLWDKAKKVAGDRPITAADIRAVKEAQSPTQRRLDHEPAPPANTTATERLVALVMRLGAAYQDWVESMPVKADRVAVTKALKELHTITG